MATKHLEFLHLCLIFVIFPHRNITSLQTVRRYCEPLMYMNWRDRLRNSHSQSATACRRILRSAAEHARAAGDTGELHFILIELARSYEQSRSWVSWNRVLDELIKIPPPEFFGAQIVCEFLLRAGRDDDALSYLRSAQDHARRREDSSYLVLGLERLEVCLFADRPAESEQIGRILFNLSFCYSLAFRYSQDLLDALDSLIVRGVLTRDYRVLLEALWGDLQRQARFLGRDISADVQRIEESLQALDDAMPEIDDE